MVCLPACTLTIITHLTELVSFVCATSNSMILISYTIRILKNQLELNYFDLAPSEECCVNCKSVRINITGATLVCVLICLLRK